MKSDTSQLLPINPDYKCVLAHPQPRLHLSPTSPSALRLVYGFKRRLARNKRGKPRLRNGKRLFEFYLPPSIEEKLLASELEMKMCGYASPPAQTGDRGER